MTTAPWRKWGWCGVLGGKAEQRNTNFFVCPHRRRINLNVWGGLNTGNCSFEEWQILVSQINPEVFESMKVPNLEDEIANLQSPIMVSWGQNDQFCPVSGAQKFAERCSNTRVMTITECGPWVMVEPP